MRPETLMLRQVNSQWIQDGRLSSLAFRASRQHDFLISVYDGSAISPLDSMDHFKEVAGLDTVGVWAVTVAEAGSHGVPVELSPIKGNPFHAHLDCRERSGGELKRLSNHLRNSADARGRLHP